MIVESTARSSFGTVIPDYVGVFIYHPSSGNSFSQYWDALKQIKDEKPEGHSYDL